MPVTASQPRLEQVPTTATANPGYSSSRIPILIQIKIPAQGRIRAFSPPGQNGRAKEPRNSGDIPPPNTDAGGLQGLKTCLLHHSVSKISEILSRVSSDRVSSARAVAGYHEPSSFSRSWSCHRFCMKNPLSRELQFREQARPGLWRGNAERRMQNAVNHGPLGHPETMKTREGVAKAGHVCASLRLSQSPLLL